MNSRNGVRPRGRVKVPSRACRLREDGNRARKGSTGPCAGTQAFVRDRSITTIRLADIFPIERPSAYKIHFARYNQVERPLDVFVRSREEWRAWQEFRPRTDQFNQRFVYSVIDFHREPDIWLFGGVWEVLERRPDSYVVSLTDQGRHFIGRLKLHSPYRQQGTRVNFEKRLNEFTVSEILREENSGMDFPGHDGINIRFCALVSLVRNDRPDWRGALENAEGVYLVSDKRAGGCMWGRRTDRGGRILSDSVRVGGSFVTLERSATQDV